MKEDELEVFVIQTPYSAGYNCLEPKCEWEPSSNALKLAKDHVKETGHEVHYWSTFGKLITQNEDVDFHPENNY